MRLRVMVAVGALAGLGVAGLAVPAAADAGSSLYVNQYASNCSDATTDSVAVPFCTIRAAADAAAPGSTVFVVGDGNQTTDPYPAVDLTRSGAPGQPITFEGATTDSFGDQLTAVVGRSGGGGFTVSGAHDIVLRGFDVRGDADGVAINDSSNIVADRLTVESRVDADGFDLTGTTGDVTISRSNVGNTNDVVQDVGTLHDIWIGSGVTHTTVTTNEIGISFGPGAVVATDAPDTVVTSNTFSINCASGVDLAGNSSGSVVENNLLYDDNAGTPAQCDATVGDIAVSSGSVANTVSDYNVLYEHNSILGKGPIEPLYNWNGTAYPSPADFTAATGQGAHDFNAEPLVAGDLPATVAIDSADANAPGELSTDFNGDPRMDDGLVSNTGTGPGYYDRGALEVQDPLAVGSVASNVSKGPFPLTVTATASVGNPWSDSVTYTFDFGDGTPLVTTSEPTATHTYTAPSPAVGYVITATATAANGATGKQLSAPVEVVAPAPLVPELQVSAIKPPLGYSADVLRSTDSWALTGATCDFGDGTGTAQAVDLACQHSYAAPGTYTITMTVTDAGGNTAKVADTIVIPSSRKLPIPVSDGGHCTVCY